MWADDFWIMSHTQKMLEQMLRLIEEASRWDLAPKPASLWWTSTYDSEEKSDINLGTSSGCYTFPFEDKFKKSGCAMNRQGKTHDAIEERMQSANKAFWKYILRIKSKDAPWKVKCRRLVHHVYMQSLRSEVKTGHGPHRQGKRSKKGWETLTMVRLFRFNRMKDETWVDFHTKTCNMAGKIWIHIDFPFLYEKFAQSIWRAI